MSTFFVPLPLVYVIGLIFGSSDHIAVSLLKDTVMTSGWQISPTDNTGFHMQFAVPPSTFNGDGESTLPFQIQIDADDDRDLRNTDMIVAFTTQQHDIFAISIHNRLRTRIYPSCTHSLLPPPPFMAAGTIEQLMSADTDNDCISRACKLCSGNRSCDDIPWLTTPLPPSAANTTTMAFVLHYDARRNLLTLTADNISSISACESCVFTVTQSFVDSTPNLNLFVVDDRNHHVNVSQQTSSNHTPRTAAAAAAYTFVLANNNNDDDVFNQVLVLFVAAGIAAVFLLLCLLDFMHSATDCGSCLGLPASDERHTLILLLLGSRMCNVTFDVAILYWLCTAYLGHSDDVSVLILVAVSLASLLITYVANLFTITRVKRLSRVNVIGDGTAEQWFKSHVCTFVMLVLVTCDTYLSLQFVAKCLQSGHSIVAFVQLRDIKKATILIHNLPQILIQIAFMTLIVDERNTLILLSVCLSALISVPYVLWWYVCSVNDQLFAWKQYDIDARLVAYDAFQVSGANGKLDQLAQMQRHLGHTRRLRRILCDMVGERSNHLEVGHVGVNGTQDGLNIHVVQKAQNDADLTQLYQGKQAALGKALHALYHISEEWTVETAIFMHGRRKSRNASVYNAQLQQAPSQPQPQSYLHSPQRPSQQRHPSSSNVAPPASITPFRLSMHAQLANHSLQTSQPSSVPYAAYQAVRSSPQPSPQPPLPAKQQQNNIAEKERLPQAPNSVSRVSDLFGSGDHDDEHVAFAIPNGTDLGLDEIQQTDTTMGDDDEEYE